MTLRHLEGIAAAILSVAAAFYLYLAWQLPVPRYATSSTPGFVPLVIGTIMLGLCLTLLGKVLLLRHTDPGEKVEFSGRGLGKIALALLALVAYAVLLEPLGFVVTSFLFLVAVTPLFGRLPVWLWLAVPAGVVIVAQIAFVNVLKLRLPSGILPL
jgi:putative tricarboxylic transport membrane protein